MSTPGNGFAGRSGCISSPGRGERGGCTHIVHDLKSSDHRLAGVNPTCSVPGLYACGGLYAVDPRFPAVPGRSTSCFHRPGRRFMHQAFRSAARRGCGGGYFVWKLYIADISLTQRNSSRVDKGKKGGLKYSRDKNDFQVKSRSGGRGDTRLLRM